MDFLQKPLGMEFGASGQANVMTSTGLAPNELPPGIVHSELAHSTSSSSFVQYSSMVTGSQNGEHDESLPPPQMHLARG